MKFQIRINFKKINGIRVDKSLLEKNPALPETTKNTIEILCQNIEKYFKENHIKVKCSFKLDNE